MESDKTVIDMNRKRVIWIILIIFWMAGIYLLSAQPVMQSNRLSEDIAIVVMRVIKRVIPTATIELGPLNNVIRKSAHFFAYLMLGALSTKALAVLRVRSRGLQIALAWVLCAGFAVSDEIHQLYVPGRGGQVRDVILDVCGATVGIAIVQLAAMGRREDEAERRKRRK